MKSFFKQLSQSVSKNQTFDLGAQLAYWSLLSLFPFAMFLLTIMGYMPLHGLDRELMSFVYSAMPHDAAKLIESTLQEIVGKQRGWLLLAALGGAAWSAAGGVGATITALNRAYNVEETRPWWKIKLMSIGLVFGGAVLIIISLCGLLIGPDIAHKIFAWVGLGGFFDTVWKYLRWPVVIVAMMFMLALTYYLLPNVKQKFRFITPGAVVAVLLWAGASLAFNAYVAHFGSYAKTYGALGTAVVLMTWLYISGLVVILGGEINAILDHVAMGMHHTEQEAGPVTVPDQGKGKGEPRENAKGGVEPDIRDRVHTPA